MTKQSEGTKKTVTVKVNRPDHDGYWAIGKFFPNGETQVEVDENQLEELKKEPYLLVGGEAASHEKPAHTHQAQPDASQSKFRKPHE